MRSALTALAVLLILALTVALVGPYFVDWNKQRGAVEAQLSRVLGQPVTIRGSINLKLLPTPYLKLGQVEVADGKSGAFFSCEALTLELGLTSLARGQFRFTQASLYRPIIALRLGPQREISLPRLHLAASSESIALEKITIRDGAVNIAQAAGQTRLAGIDLEAEADSLSGPFKGSGEATGPGGARTAFHFATGAVEDSQLRLKASVESGLEGARGEFDGALVFAPAAPASGVVALGYSGEATFAGQVETPGALTPWRAAGTLKADLRHASFSDLNVRIGPEDRALSADGSVEIKFGTAPQVDVTLAAKQLNLDSLLRSEGNDSVSPAQAYEGLSRILAAVRFEGGPPIGVSLGLQTPAVVLGGDTIADVSVTASGNPGSPLNISLEASPPGRSHIRATGAVDLGPALGFKGRVEAQTEEAQRLREWLGSGAPELTARLAAVSDFLPYQNASVAGDMDFSQVGLVARNLNLSLERSTFDGTAAFTRAIGSQRGRMFLDLQSDAVDLDAFPSLEASSQLFGDIDLSVTLNARAIRIARLGEADLQGGSLALRLSKQGDDFRLDRLSIGSLGGASIEASGANDKSGRWLNAEINAGDLSDFSALARRVAPGWVSDQLADRAMRLSPAKLDLSARWSRSTAQLASPPDTLDVEGALGATRLTAKVGHADADPNGLEATLLLDAPDAAALLQQVGVPASSASSLGGGRVSASVRGRWGDTLEAQIAATVGVVDLSWRGQFAPQGLAADGAPAVSGAGSLKAVNAGPLLAALGIMSPIGTPAVPTDVSARVSWRSGQLDLTQLKGAIGGTHVSGDLTYRPAPPAPAPTLTQLAPAESDLKLAEAIVGSASAPPAPRPQLEGALSLDKLSLATLAGLSLGSPQSAQSKTRWSDAKFTAGLIGGPSADIALKIASLDVADNLVASNVSTRLKLGRGLVGLDDLSMSIADGVAHGRATIRRNGPDASLAGRISVDSIVVDRLSLAGRLSGALEFSGTGQSPGALIAGLAGAGQIQYASARIPHLDQGALGRIVAKAQSSDYAIDEVNISHALDVELNKQMLRIPDGNAPLSLASGIIRLGPVDLPGPTDDAKLEVTFDLQSYALELRVAFTELRAPKFWSGSPPAVSIVLKGPVDAPTRRIDSSLLVAGLSAQAIARETERIAALESDIRERAFFNRRLKADQFLRRRELELDAYALAQQRQKWEADRRRVEDETLKAADEKRKAAADPSLAPLPPPLPDPTPHDPLQSTNRAQSPSPPPLPAPRPPQPGAPSAGSIY